MDLGRWEGLWGAAEETWVRAESTDPGLSCRHQAGGAPNPAASLRRSSRGAPMTRWRARLGWGGGNPGAPQLDGSAQVC